MKIPSPAELKHERVNSLQEQIDRIISDVVERLRKDDAFTVSSRGTVLAVEAAVGLLRAAGWHCEISKGGARDNGATDGFTVSAKPIRCSSCGGRGSWSDERGVYDHPLTCSICSGKGVVS